MGKSKRKSSKCNSSAASCGIGTVDVGARGLRADHAASSRLSRALSRLDLPCLSCLSVPCDSLRFTAVYCVCYSASTHDNKRGKLLLSHFSAAFVAGWERRREEISPKKTAYRPQRVFDSDRSPACFKTGNSSSSAPVVMIERRD